MTIKKCVRWLLLAILISFILIATTIGCLLLQAHWRQTENRIEASPKNGFFVPAYDTRIFVQRTGAQDAPAVIFIHGTGAWSEIWQPAMNLAANLGYQSIAFDLPPFGYSIPPASGRYDKVSQARRIISAMDSLHIEKAIFVSHSIGSSPLMEALLNHPERVNKLIMINPALGLQSALTDGSDSTIQTWLRKRWFGQTIAACLFTNPILTSTLVKNFVTEKDKVTEKWVDIYRKPFKLEDSYQSIALWLPELLAGRSIFISDQPLSYRLINYPVTLIWGKNDQITPISQAYYLQELIHDSELKLISGGHVPMIEEPDEFASALSEALHSDQMTNQ